MKKALPMFVTILLGLFILQLSGTVFAHSEGGEDIYANLRAGNIKCEDLEGEDFEKLGDYFMGQALQDEKAHEAMDAHIERMMGQDAERQMHIAWGVRGSDCGNSQEINFNQRGGGIGMMWGNPGMWGGNAAGVGVFLGILWLVTWVSFTAVLVALARLLWKKGDKVK